MKEGMASGFAEYARTFGRVSMSAGLRYEHVSFDYYEEDRHIDAQSRKYDNLFPSLNVNFPIGKAQVYSGIRTMYDYNTLFRKITFTMSYKFNTAKNKYKGTGAGQGQRGRM